MRVFIPQPIVLELLQAVLAVKVSLAQQTVLELPIVTD